MEPNAGIVCGPCHGFGTADGEPYPKNAKN